MKKYILIISSITVLLCSCGENTSYRSYGIDSPIFPDYRDVTVPENIAPLNFSYINPESDDFSTVFKAGGYTLEIHGRDVKINNSDWKNLLNAAKKKAVIDVYSSEVEEGWKIYVSPDKIDYGVTYRLVPPGYGLYSKLGIYEYNFETAGQKTIIENKNIESNCINCHSFKGNDPTTMCFHIRGNHSGTLMLDGEDLKIFDTKTSESGGNCVYPYWHPDGKHIAFSVNKTRQSFFINPEKLIEVYDHWSDMWVYDVQENRLFTNKSLSGEEYLETFPAFSSDGTSLFFCRANAIDTLGNKENLHYDICRVSFDAASGTLGTDVEILVNARSIGKSALFPRPSYDGRFLIYTLCDYGTFPIWHKESDLWIMDLRDGSSRPLVKANSNDTESYHSWSCNSRWVVFSSRRDDTRFTRLYITHIDENGNETKAVMLPQKNPVNYYNSLFYSYNVPNFIEGPVKLPKYKMLKAIHSSERKKFEN